MTEEQFRELCVNHDLTFSYSDNHRVWQRGNASLQKVHEAAEQLPRETVVRIWNEVVETKLIPSAQNQFKWKE